MRNLDEGDKVLLQRGMEQLTVANAIMRFLSDHFRDKYGLTPSNEITPDGRIVESTLPGFSGVPSQENGRNSASDDLRIVQSEVAVFGETNGD
jgi:hypothetical protein